MEKEELKKYRQFQKCYADDGHYHCKECNAILDNLSAVNFDKEEGVGKGSKFLIIFHGVIFHLDGNIDLDMHRIDSFTSIEEEIKDEA